nr:MAG TPA: hypothetical protein [Caudoviricetes sp.]
MLHPQCPPFLYSVPRFGLNSNKNFCNHLDSNF